LDFFLLAPSGVALFVQGGGTAALRVTPVVRVHTTTQELDQLIDQCEPIAIAIEAELAEVGK
jgi:hypothetical protein